MGRELVDQLDWHWQQQLRPRLEGLSNDEYFWEPVANCWSIRRRDGRTDPQLHGSDDWATEYTFDEYEQEPFTTIAWRLGHVIVDVFLIRVGRHFGGSVLDDETFAYAGSAGEALGQLDEAYAAWVAGVLSLDGEDLRRPCGSREPHRPEASMAELVLHINREAIHHGAEIALLRDLYAHGLR
ncbi:MAG: DinB family protein [Nocardioidaceae bacterium]|nr:DinB family protein [Nocardioidaceae bacterium]